MYKSATDVLDPMYKSGGEPGFSRMRKYTPHVDLLGGRVLSNFLNQPRVGALRAFRTP